MTKHQSRPGAEWFLSSSFMLHPFSFCRSALSQQARKETGLRGVGIALRFIADMEVGVLHQDFQHRRRRLFVVRNAPANIINGIGGELLKARGWRVDVR